MFDLCADQQVHKPCVMTTHNEQMAVTTAMTKFVVHGSKLSSEPRHVVQAPNAAIVMS